MKKIVSLWVGLLFSLAAIAADNRFDTMVIFGDSMSDNGNLYRYTLHLLPNSPPYYRGHFSNGQLWVEYLYDSYFPSTYKKGFQDYAVGGAGAVLSRKGILPVTLAMEVNDYLYWHTYGHIESSLFTIWVGANNYLKAPDNVEELTSEVVKAISMAIERLIAKGGNKFLLANLPDLTRMPIAKNNSNAMLLNYLTLAHNRKLAVLIDKLRAKYPNCVFIYFDTYAFVNQSIDKAADYGFDNISDPCYLGRYAGWLAMLHAQQTITPNNETLHQYLQQQSPTLTKEQWLMIKTNPDLREAALTGYRYSLLPLALQTQKLQCDNYVFWDKVHPTTMMHKLIAEQIKLQIRKAGLLAVMPEAFNR